MKAWIVMVAASAAMVAGAAQASDVSWSVTIGSPRPAPRVIYTPPPVVYTPPPVIYHPVPVVYHPVVSAPPVYRIAPGHLKKWYKHEHRYAYGHRPHGGHGHH
jgi:hypothetical protein